MENFLSIYLGYAGEETEKQIKKWILKCAEIWFSSFPVRKHGLLYSVRKIVFSMSNENQQKLPFKTLCQVENGIPGSGPDTQF